ncbi:MAG: hypothetical protein LIP01_13885 [Tannerellaceae bacterium]|nr:hypothetical protein [Tannerellaceae bacterium]
MKYLILPLVILFSLLSLIGCEIDSEGRYVQPGQLTGLLWKEGWTENGVYTEHSIRFNNNGSGNEQFYSAYNFEDYYFTWDWLDEVTLILYYENGEILYFDIYELSAFRLYGRLANEIVDFTT